MWNNRIFYDKEKKCFNVHETFYNDKGEVVAFGESPVKLEYFASIKDLTGSIEQINKDVIKSSNDVLDYDMKCGDWDVCSDDDDYWKRLELKLFFYDKTNSDFEFAILQFSDESLFSKERSLISIGTDAITKKIKLKSLLFFIL